MKRVLKAFRASRSLLRSRPACGVACPVIADALPVPNRQVHQARS
jgi:hypothetical protein